MLVDLALKNPKILSLVDACVFNGTPLMVSLPSAQAFLACLISTRLSDKLGIVINDSHNDEALSRDLSSFFGDVLAVFPSFKDGHSNVSGFASKERLLFERSLGLIVSGESTTGAVKESALAYSLGGGFDKAGPQIKVTVGNEASRALLIEKLESWGYENVERCFSPQTFSVKGGIVDVYPTNRAHPIRFEYFSNTIESIREYDEESQRSLKEFNSATISQPIGLNENKGASFRQVFKSYYKNLLYITKDSLSFKNKVNNDRLDVYVEPIKAPLLEKADFIKKVDSWASACSSVYVFNPKRVGFQFSGNIQEVYSAISSGFRIKPTGLVCVAAPKQRQLKTKRPPLPFGVEAQQFGALNEIEWGDLLVHVDYGIGVYRGLSIVGKKGSEEENIKIEYKDGGLVYVPINRFGRVHKYVGSGGAEPTLSRLGSGVWEKQKQVTKKSVASVVEHLVSSYKSRMEPRGFSYTNDKNFLDQLEMSFVHEETPDQLAAIDDIYSDLDKPYPMDRLLYGDVGFGKTEVALRAAMRVVVSGRAVFFLAPTTVLSDQHYITCKSRLSPLGVEIELLSRFKTKKQQSEIIERLHRNQIDVLVGTHRLLGKDVSTNNLGLLIIDEEQRFGVKHKETIRRLKSRVDILTLTATPIPRTLQQSLVGIRDTSKIETPPTERLPIETSVGYFNWEEVKRAILFETSRGGQVYFLNNDISTLAGYYENITALIPHISVSIAHGQMGSRELEKTVLAFFDGTIDVLLCTTIIESGLDVENANTIIINDAQNFGLSQLYQIRGRVGRGKRQAHCFLFIPKNTKLLSDANQRLRALQHYSALGSGYGIAMRDLEIRGSGNLFGYEQSGEVSRVGLELYNKILSSALNEEQGRADSVEKEPMAVIYSQDAYLGSDYMPLVQDRLGFYEKISKVRRIEDLNDIKNEALDRFGRFSNKEESLFFLSEIRCRLYAYPLTKCKIEPLSVVFSLSSVPNGLEPSAFLKNLEVVFKNQPTPYKVSPQRGGVLDIVFFTKTIEQGLSFAVNFDRLFSQVVSG